MNDNFIMMSSIYMTAWLKSLGLLSSCGVICDLQREFSSRSLSSLLALSTCMLTLSENVSASSVCVVIQLHFILYWIKFKFCVYFLRFKIYAHNEFWFKSSLCFGGCFQPLVYMCKVEQDSLGLKNFKFRWCTFSVHWVSELLQGVIISFLFDNHARKVHESWWHVLHVGLGSIFRLNSFMCVSLYQLSYSSSRFQKWKLMEFQSLSR